jgi:predicted AAA+ superfamily ATPase
MRRESYLEEIKMQLRIHPVCGILGARQVGKTTLARQFIEQYKGKVEIMDLEDPVQLKRLENPMLTLSLFPDHLIVIDEIQRRPELFPILRVLVDNPHKKYTFLILGSASRDLIRQSSETLAGRIGYIELPPFTLCEVDEGNRLLLRGGFPRSYLARSEQDSFEWRRSYIQTFLERDLAGMGFDVTPQAMGRLWAMLCAYHGQILNTAALSTSLMISHQTVTRYIDILAGTFMIRVLQPWFENITKRQVKRPKIYFRDSGIFNTLSSIRTRADLARSPQLGALEQIIMCLDIDPNDCYFWSTHNEAELDLFIFRPTKRIGFEIKYTDAPHITKSIRIALDDLKLDHIYIIYPGTIKFPMDDKITACGLDALSDIR